jgi:flagellar biosynthesis/type III secretory pathway M-ring protein FliF/YscJ
MPFAQEGTDIAALADKEKKREFFASLIKPAIFLIITLLVLLFAIRPLIHWLKTVKVVERGHDSRGILSQAHGLSQLETEELPQIEAIAKSEEMKHMVQGKRKAIERTSRDDMNTATAVVKSWLQENA